MMTPIDINRLRQLRNINAKRDLEPDEEDELCSLECMEDDET